MPIQFTCPHCGVQTNVSDEYAGSSGPCTQCGKTITVPPLGAQPPYAAPARSSSKTWLIILVAAVPALLIVGVAVIGILIALLLPAVQAAREAARRTQCANNLHQISIALMSYEAAYGCFPPAYIADESGKPMHSWRVLILPFMEQEFLYEQYDFDQPWDSPNNCMVTDTMLPIYQCASAAPNDPWETNYVMIVGPETIASENSAVKMADVPDGLSNTIMLIETADSGIQWAEPRDLNFDELNLQINDGSGEGIRSHHPGGVNAAFCDGSVHFLQEGVDAETLRRLIDRKDGMPVDPGSF
jgi:prepilin-type processing-associated H-X9-DG protein